MKPVHILEENSSGSKNRVEKKTSIFGRKVIFGVGGGPLSEVMAVSPLRFSKNSRQPGEFLYLALRWFDSQCTDVEITKNGNIRQLFHTGKRNIGGCHFYHSREHVQIDDDFRYFDQCAVNIVEDTGSAIRKIKFTRNVFLQQKRYARNKWLITRYMVSLVIRS